MNDKSYQCRRSNLYAIMFRKAKLNGQFHLRCWDRAKLASDCVLGFVCVVSSPLGRCNKAKK
jgi:hypothetical protein